MDARRLPPAIRAREWVKAHTSPPIRRALTTLYRLSRPRELRAIGRFLRTQHRSESLGDRLTLVARCVGITLRVDCAHQDSELLAVIGTILRARSDGVVVEAGAFKGGSTAKLSLACALAGRRLVVFDSFEGIPRHDERHTLTDDGAPTGFAPGDYAGSLDEVASNIRRHGELARCEFRKGWFEETLPRFDEPIVAAYVDVDLASSTETCMRYLYPRLTQDGAIYSQDGHLALVVAVLQEFETWAGGSKPRFDGLSERKLVGIRPPDHRSPARNARRDDGDARPADESTRDLATGRGE